MITKVLAAKRAAGSGASTVIAWGREPDVLLRLAAGEAIGTRAGAPTRRSSRRASSGWSITCSCAARWSSTTAPCAKLRDEGKSLLPIGVVEVQGEFQRGDVIAVRDAARRGAGARPGQLLEHRGAADRAQALDADRGSCWATSTSRN